MASFSERYGYVHPAAALKREGLDRECAIALCNCYDHLALWFNEVEVSPYSHYSHIYRNLEEHIWCFFLNQRRNDFFGFRGNQVVATKYLLSEDFEWNKKFDLIEFSIESLRKGYSNDAAIQKVIDRFVKMANSTFQRMNYAYRIVDDQIVEITDKVEISAIENAIKSEPAIKTHLSNALRLLSDRPTPDYRNSIKESISAVEVLCREITGEITLGPALRSLEKKGVVIPNSLRSGIEKLYVYTNDEKTGIRHALMDETEVPHYEEAKFMLVACSAFVNYIQEKRSK